MRPPVLQVQEVVLGMRPFLIERWCRDPNPHDPHVWDTAVVVDRDERRFWCKGVKDVSAPAVSGMLGE